jgi:Transposase DDE domain
VRERSKPSTAKCTQNLYILFLLAEPKYVSCVRLSEVMADLSHDSVNRFLLREKYTPKDLFDEVKDQLNLVGGSASVDDSVIDKPYSDPNKAALIDYFWSGKHKRTVKGINLITLYYTDIAGNSYPVSFRIYDKQNGKTKNDYFREMVKEVQSWGLKPDWVTGDSWYSSIENLKFLRNEKVSFLFGIADNRLVSIEQGSYVQVKTLTIPEAGMMVYLKEFGLVKVFAQNFKNEVRHYISYLPVDSELLQLNRQDFRRIHDSHWQIESFHRVIKQVCNIERFQVRTESAIRTHFFCALQAFCRLQTMRVQGLINNLYQISRDLFVPIIRQFIIENLPQPISV